MRTFDHRDDRAHGANEASSYHTQYYNAAQQSIFPVNSYYQAADVPSNVSYPNEPTSSQAFNYDQHSSTAERKPRKRGLHHSSKKSSEKRHYFILPRSPPDNFSSYGAYPAVDGDLRVVAEEPDIFGTHSYSPEQPFADRYQQHNSYWYDIPGDYCSETNHQRPSSRSDFVNTAAMAGQKSNSSSQRARRHQEHVASSSENQYSGQQQQAPSSNTAHHFTHQFHRHSSAQSSGIYPGQPQMDKKDIKAAQEQINRDQEALAAERAKLHQERQQLLYERQQLHQERQVLDAERQAFNMQQQQAQFAGTRFGPLDHDLDDDDDDDEEEGLGIHGSFMNPRGESPEPEQEPTWFTQEWATQQQSGIFTSFGEMPFVFPLGLSSTFMNDFMDTTSGSTPFPSGSHGRGRFFTFGGGGGRGGFFTFGHGHGSGHGSNPFQQQPASHPHAFQQSQSMPGPTPEQAQGAFTSYNSRWNALSPTDSNIPYPTLTGSHEPLLSSPAGVSLRNLDHRTSWSHETLVQVNTAVFFIRAFGLPIRLESDPRRLAPVVRIGREMAFGVAGVEREKVERLQRQLKVEKTRWHSDRMGRRGVRDEERVRSVFQGVSDLYEQCEKIMRGERLDSEDR